MKYDRPIAFLIQWLSLVCIKDFFVFLFISLVPLIEHSVLMEGPGFIEDAATALKCIKSSCDESEFIQN